jgi:hypothetical protein
MNKQPNVQSRTTISISEQTKIILSKLGKFGQSYNDIIKELLSKKGIEN